MQAVFLQSGLFMTPHGDIWDDSQQHKDVSIKTQLKAFLDFRNTSLFSENADVQIVIYSLVPKERRHYAYLFWTILSFMSLDLDAYAYQFIEWIYYGRVHS